jgi:ADP-heptose:LPS heptosyltransferase
MCAEICKRHPGRLLLFVTIRDYQGMVQLASEPDAVYGARSWKFVPRHRLLGLIEKVYAPKTTDEISKEAGPTVHLIDDLAASCGIALTERQPKLLPSRKFIEAVLLENGLPPRRPKTKKLIGINCGLTWPVKQWSFDHWQALLDRIHAEYDATILLFGIGGDKNEFTRLRGIESFANHRASARELVALVAACDLVISIDSGPIHVAGAVGTPVVGLFGANNGQLRLPPASPGVGLVADVPCLYCHHRTPRGHWQSGCPCDIRCMKELEVAPVFQAVKEMLEKQSPGPRRIHLLQ